MKNILLRGGIEFLAVLLGITGSLYIDRLNNENEIKDETRDSFISLIAELDENINNLELWHSHIEISLNQFEILLGTNNYSSLTNKELDRMFFYTLSSFGEKMRSSIFNSMESSGLIYKIDDKKIRNLILELYQITYTRHDWLLDFDQVRFQQMFELVANEFIFDDKPTINKGFWNLDWANKRNIEQLKTNYKYRNFLISNRGNKNMYLSQNKVAKKMTEEVLLELNNYLK